MAASAAGQVTMGNVVSAERSASLLQRALGVKHAQDVRQLATVGTYYALLASMYFVPACRNVFFLVAACAYSFLTAVVGHNVLHQGMFDSKRRNVLFRYVLSFGALFPISAVIPSHNLVHHHFDDDGQPDWAAPEHVRFEWNLLNLLHFPNVAGPLTFNGVQRWARIQGRGEFRRQYMKEQIFAFGLTGVLLAFDFWTALFFVVVPQLWGARSFLRINILQHDGADVESEWNHSRNFVGKLFNWFMMNNGYHTIHHNRAGMHWSELAAAHEREVVPRMDPSLDEKSMLAYLARTYLFRFSRPRGKDVAAAERAAAPVDIASREVRRAEAEAEAC
ncbi:MAG TPA: fatty acid desaturase [Polyangiaceae bacterium]|nr:fatty acid desaturase [Polyangiaceae bacterium]